MFICVSVYRSNTMKVFSDTLMTPEDPRWIGAWWLGFLVFGAIAIVLATPMMCFPRRLAGSWRNKMEDSTKEDKKEKTLSEKVKGNTYFYFQKKNWDR